MIRPALVINYSAGKDSEAMLAYLCEKYPAHPKYVIHADTGFEHVKPFTAQEWGRMRVARYGLDLNVCRNPNKTYLEMVERRGMFPAPKYRQCTSDLKRGPIETWIRNHVHERHIINCTGIRAEESAQRAKQNPLKKNHGLSKNGRTVWNWMPIFRWSEQQVLQYLSDREIPLHPIYVWAGGYLRRFSCRVCIFSTDSDIRAIYHHDREAFDLVSGLETKLGFTMKQNTSLIEIIGAGEGYGQEQMESALPGVLQGDGAGEPYEDACCG